MKVFVLHQKGNKNYLPILVHSLDVKISSGQIFLQKAIEQIKEPIFDIAIKIEEASFLLIPYDFFSIEKEEEYLREAERLSLEHDKKILVFDYSDFDRDINVKNSLIFRTSKYRSTLKENEFIIPIIIEDLGKRYGVTFREKKTKLVVGFAGWAAVSVWQYIKFFIKELPIRFLSVFNECYKVNIKGIFWRIKTNKILKNSSLVTTNFLIRKSYSGHVMTAENNLDVLRKEFINNLINSDYILIIRGDANAATRFYEALSLGRIPLILDTDLIFPFEDIIDYRKFCIFVDFRDVGRIDKIIRKFHDSITNERFIEMQKNAREVYLKHLEVNKFGVTLSNKLASKI